MEQKSINEIAKNLLTPLFYCSRTHSELMENSKILNGRKSIAFLIFFLCTSVIGEQSFNVIEPIRRMNNESSNCDTSISCSVDTKLGKINGKELKTVLGDPENVRFCSYRGIPYAKPPIGDLRFKVIL